VLPIKRSRTTGPPLPCEHFPYSFKGAGLRPTPGATAAPSAPFAGPDLAALSGGRRVRAAPPGMTKSPPC
jgi:hypothetical protein